MVSGSNVPGILQRSSVERKARYILTGGLENRFIDFDNATGSSASRMAGPYRNSVDVKGVDRLDFIVSRLLQNGYWRRFCCVINLLTGEDELR